MSIKTKKSQSSVEKLATFTKQAGVLLMTTAVTIGMLELPDHPNNRIVVPNQPAFALASQNSGITNTLRREREETAPHFISYSETQRTPARSGRV